MSRYRVRASRDTAVTGAFAWAELHADGSVAQAGMSDSEPLPAPGSCELILASDVVLLHRVPVPAAQRRRLGGNLRFLVEEIVAADPERLHVVEVAAPGRDEVSVGIVERAWLQAVLARLAACGLKVERALAETLLPPLEPHEWTVVWQGTQSFVRTGKAAGFVLDVPGEAGATPMALRLAARKAAPAGIVVRPESGAALPPTDAWSAELGVPVEAGAPWHWAEAPGDPSADFLQGELAPGRGERGWRQRLRRPAMLAASLLLAASAGLAADWAIKAQERRSLVAQMNAIYRDTFGPTAVLVDPPLQMQRALAGMKQRTGEPAADDFLALLRLSGETFLDPAKHRVQALSYQNGRLAIVLAPHDPAAFGAMVEEMRGKASIPGREVKIETQDAKGAPQLRLIVGAESGRWALARP